MPLELCAGRLALRPADCVQLEEKEVAMFALNDNPDVATAEGGSHW